MKIAAIVESATNDIECERISFRQISGPSDVRFDATLEYWYPKERGKFKPGEVYHFEVRAYEPGEFNE